MSHAIQETTLDSLKSELARRDKQFEAVGTISRALSRKVAVHEVIREALEVSMQVVNAGAGSVILYDPKKEKLVFRYVTGPAAPQLTGLELNPDQGICGQVFQSGEPIISDDPTRDKRHLRTVGEQVHYITKNMVSVPLKSMEGRCIGVMQILNKAETNFDEEDLELLTVVGQQAATAIDNTRLHEEAKLAVVVNLMGDISHDIKNLITPVQTCTQTLEMLFRGFFEDADKIIEESQSNGEGIEALERLQLGWEFLRGFYPEAIEMIIDGCISTQERVREIADCVKGIVAKPMFEFVDANDVIEKAIKPLKLFGQRREITVKHEPGQVPRTMIDQKQLYNAVYNLVNNAIPETPRGGSVTVRTYARLDGDFPEGGYVMIEVADTGSGIPEHVRQRLFTEDAVSTKPGGTGLGTRIVKNVVESHRGKITVESEEGRGSRFFVRIPICDSVPPAEENGQ